MLAETDPEPCRESHETLITKEAVSKAEADPMVQRPGLLEMAGLYLCGADPRSPLAAPIYADLKGLTPLLIQVGAGGLRARAYCSWNSGCLGDNAQPELAHSKMAWQSILLIAVNVVAPDRDGADPTAFQATTRV